LPSSSWWLREDVPDQDLEREIIIMWKRIALAVVAALASIGAVAGLAGPTHAAEATTHPGIIKYYTTSYSAPSNQTGVVHTGLLKDTIVDVHCFREGQVLNGNGYWFVVEKDGDAGYVHSEAISVPSNVAHC